MTENLPQSVLFCCDHNAVRSPMAEGIMKKFYGTDTYVQSVGVKNDLEVDGFSIAVCAEMDVELARHRSRSFDEMEQWGDDPGRGMACGQVRFDCRVKLGGIHTKKRTAACDLDQVVLTNARHPTGPINRGMDLIRTIDPQLSQV